MPQAEWKPPRITTLLLTEDGSVVGYVFREMDYWYGFAIDGGAETPKRLGPFTNLTLARIGTETAWLTRVAQPITECATI